MIDIISLLKDSSLLYVLSTLYMTLGIDSLRSINLEKNKRRFIKTMMSIRCINETYEQYTAEFKYVLPNGRYHGRYFELFMTIIMGSNIYHVTKKTRSYVNGRIAGVETKYDDWTTFTQSRIRSLKNIITSNDRTQNSMDIIKYFLSTNPNYELSYILCKGVRD
jgi:hypothetical protein